MFDNLHENAERDLQKRIAAFDKKMHRVLADIEAGLNGYDPDAMFKDIGEFLNGGEIHLYPELQMRFLQLTQRHCGAMIDALLERDEMDAIDTAAQIYLGWHDVYEYENYPNEDRLDMILDQGQSLLLKTSEPWEDGDDTKAQILAAAILDKTLIAQSNLLARTQFVRDYMRQPEKMRSERFAEELSELENYAAEEKEAIAAFIKDYAPSIILQTPNITEDGLDHQRKGNSFMHRYYRQEYVYSYVDESASLYKKSATLLAQTDSVDAFVDFAQQLMPALPQLYLKKNISYQLLSKEDGSITGGDTWRDTENMLDVMRTTYKLLSDHAPASMMAFVDHAYDDIAYECIKLKEPAALCELYDATCAALKDKENKPNDHLSLFMNAYASRTMNQMIRLRETDQADAFLRHIYRTSACSPSETLVLLNENAASILGVCMPMNDGKACATMLFTHENGVDTTHIAVHKNHKAATSSKAFGRKTQATLLKRAEKLSEELLENGMMLEHQALTQRWRTIEYKNG